MFYIIILQANTFVSNNINIQVFKHFGNHIKIVHGLMRAFRKEVQTLLTTPLDLLLSSATVKIFF